MNTNHRGDPSRYIFWGCFIALITTSMAFITRALLLGRFATDFNLDPVETGRLFGAGLWPFAISIILFSLVIDRVGYRKAMVLSFACYAVYGLLAFVAFSRVHAAGLAGPDLAAAQQSGQRLLWWGSVILGLGNGRTFPPPTNCRVPGNTLRFATEPPPGFLDRRSQALLA